MPNLGLTPPDLNTPVGQVRLLLGDTDPAIGSGDQGEYLFYSDKEIEALLALHGGSAKRTVVRILRSTSFAQVYLLKKFTSADVSVDGPAVARELRLQALDLEREADDDDARGGANEIFQVVPTGRHQHTHFDGLFRERMDGLMYGLDHGVI